MGQRTSGEIVGSRRPWGFAWALLALLTCPCHLPLVVFLFAGTTAGAFMGEHMGLAAASGIVLFGLSSLFAFRSFKE